MDKWTFIGAEGPANHETERAFRASHTFGELCALYSTTDSTIRSIAAKLDEMLPVKLTPVAPEPIKRGHCVFPKFGCRGSCAALPDAPVPDGVFRPTPKRQDDGRLYEAARAIYESATWKNGHLVWQNHIQLWQELHDALGLKAGDHKFPD